ncbi:hypothetical protein GWP40_08385 [Treponema vincentii]|uniref:hypothetical protein n=1 Tax=Treponema vincentii TaxID=69710 RepID=UPI001BAEB651|nr:hypothetical protein [Treponema vincentii]QUY18325.1 hypothetical protein GWP40_08385 [Treponema vincentii]
MAYVKKVKIFSSINEGVLEKIVNIFLSKEVECGFSIMSVQYQIAINDNPSTVCYSMLKYSCMVYYSEPAEE